MTVELYFDMIGRKTAALIAASIEAGALLATDDEDVIARYRGVRLGARARLPAQRRPARDLGRRAGDRQGRVRRRPQEEDPAGDLRLRARRARGSAASGRAVRVARTRARPRSPRSSRSSSGPVPATTPATRPAATATRRSPSSTRRACSSRRPASTSRGSSSRSSPRSPVAGRAPIPEGAVPAGRSHPSLAVGLVVLGCSVSRSRTTSTLPTRRPSVVSTVSVRPSTRTWSPGLGTPPMRW